MARANSVDETIARIRPRRAVTGMAAVLLPFGVDQSIAWDDFENLLGRTVSAGLTPAVNMDTGYVNLLSVSERDAVLGCARSTLGDAPFVAGAYVDSPEPALDFDGYARAVDAVQAVGATPVVFPSPGLNALDDDALIDVFRRIGERCDRFIAFELGPMFVPFGRIYPLEVYRALLDIPTCIGAKHSSLDRGAEWERLALRDGHRPDFRVFTGNDLAIDMVMYGSDYLLGLAAFAPDFFARRDRYWADGDAAFFALNDALQAIGSFAFRSPVPAYKHSAAQFLHLRDWIGTDQTHPRAPRRPASDTEILRSLLEPLSDGGA